jgi:hypothetical protein
MTFSHALHAPRSEAPIVHAVDIGEPLLPSYTPYPMHNVNTHPSTHGKLLIDFLAWPRTSAKAWRGEKGGGRERETGDAHGHNPTTASVDVCAPHPCTYRSTVCRKHGKCQGKCARWITQLRHSTHLPGTTAHSVHHTPHPSDPDLCHVETREGAPIRTSSPIVGEYSTTKSALDI